MYSIFFTLKLYTNSFHTNIILTDSITITRHRENGAKLYVSFNRMLLKQNLKLCHI